MPTMINRGKDLLRICPSNTAKLEYSTNSGHTWSMCFGGNTGVGHFSDLVENGKEILGTTDKGLYYSVNGGRSWSIRHK